MMEGMKALFLTNEYPPYIYGGAGVHVDYLSRALSKRCEVEIRCFGDQKHRKKNLNAMGIRLNNRRYTAPGPLQIVFGAMQRCVDFNTRNVDADIVHAHTWYTHFGGILAKLCYSIPLVITTHSLEPLRPWKREQLTGGYDFTCWIEKMAIEMADAIVAVSGEAKKDILRLFDVDPKKIHIIYNGVDPEEYRPVRNPAKLKRFGIDPSKPYVLFVGRITRQKGIIHLVNAIKYMNPGFQVVLCAGAPDTKAIGNEMAARVAKVRKTREGVIWISEMLDVPTKVALYSHADLFCCPSIYEPFGIINLEAMACETPVVATAVGGIKEVVAHGKTGLLVPIRQKKTSPFEPLQPEQFSKNLAHRINRLMANKSLRLKMGKAGRRRALDIFSWKAIAKQHYDLYRSLICKK